MVENNCNHVLEFLPSALEGAYRALSGLIDPCDLGMVLDHLIDMETNKAHGDWMVDGNIAICWSWRGVVRWKFKDNVSAETYVKAAEAYLVRSRGAAASAACTSDMIAEALGRR